MTTRHGATNDTVSLSPQSEFAGPTLDFDMAAVKVGCAEYHEGPTGCTVFHFPSEVKVAADVRGGMPGTMMAADGYTDAIVWAGGSLCGLQAATGVTAELFARSGHDFGILPMVRAAVIHDYGPRKGKNTIYPDAVLGRAAVAAARPGVFPLGARGAGRSVAVGKFVSPRRAEPSGQGGAVRQIGKTKVAVFTVVNALGVIVNRHGEVLLGNRDPRTGERVHILANVDLAAEALFSGGSRRVAPNTTLTLVVTNRKLELHELAQLGRQVHSSMARAIQPFHTRLDGDVLFTVTTGEVRDSTVSKDGLGLIASEVAWDAVLSCAAAATQEE